MAYLLDTSICVFFLRGRLDLDKWMKDKGPENCYISEITVFELRYGAENSANAAASHSAVGRFIAGLSIVPVYGCVRRYAKEKIRLRKSGTPMHDEFDLLIGVSAVENGLTLVTDNVGDFSHVAEIRIENWMAR